MIGPWLWQEVRFKFPGSGELFSIWDVNLHFLILVTLVLLVLLPFVLRDLLRDFKLKPFLGFLLFTVCLGVLNLAPVWWANHLAEKKKQAAQDFQSWQQYRKTKSLEKFLGS